MNPKSAGKPGSVTARLLTSRYDCHSSKAPRCRGARAAYPRTRRAASSSAYLALLRMEVAAFHPLPFDRKRLVSVALFLTLANRASGWRMAAGRYPASCSMEPGLSSIPTSGTAAVWLASDAEHSTSPRTPSGGNDRAPSQRVAGRERHDAIGAQRALRRHLPVLPSQRDRVGVALQPVEIGTVEAREALERVERAGGVEHFRIEFERGGRRVAAGASAGALFRVSRMGRAVGAEEELRIA